MLSGRVISSIFAQSRNALAEISASPSANLTELTDEQPENAELSISPMPFERSIAPSAEQSEKANSQILSIFDFTVSAARFSQLENAYSPISLTPSPRVISESAEHHEKV